ncbi:hypothetical protein AAEQ26_000257 [Enterobacter hormaechei]
MSTITREFTKEQLQQIEAAAKEVLWPVMWSEKKARKHFSEKITPEVVLELARIALASLEAKSRKLFTCSGCGAEGLDEPLESKCHCNEDSAHWVESIVYTAPPAPVSAPDESAVESLAADLMKRIDRITGERHSVATLSSLRVSIVESCRSAMLQGAAGNSPVIPDGWVLVPIEPTYQMCEAMGLQWESPRFPDRYKAMLAAVKK